MTQDEFNAALNREGILEREEERDIFLFYQAHPTKENRNRIALKNDGLVWKSASRLSVFGVPKEDLHLEGFIGLMKAVDRFDPERGTKFSTCAKYWIDQSILRFLQNHGRNIRMPAHMVVTYGQIAKFQKSYMAEAGCQPSDREIARGTGISEKEVRRVLDTASHTATSSLNIQMYDDGKDNTEMQDCLTDTSPSPEDEAVGRASRQEMVAYVKARLTKREWEIISRRCGFQGDRQTLEVIGRDMGLTRERVRQIEAQALNKLKTPVAMRYFQSFR